MLNFIIFSIIGMSLFFCASMDNHFIDMNKKQTCFISFWFGPLAFLYYICYIIWYYLGDRK